MSQRLEFVMLADQEVVPMAELCRRFGISRRCGYRWLKRHRAGESMADRSRRPHGSPRQYGRAVEETVLGVRAEHPTWGGRKIARRLRDLGHSDVPAPSTVTAILHRHGLIDPAESVQHRPCRRFEHERPNDLWQMDFKGHFGTADGRRCHPLTVLDDHSRYAVGLEACADEQHMTVWERLTLIFERYGLPRRVLCDNGPPWGVPDPGVSGIGLTRLGVWLIRLGVDVTHGRPLHPQTQGKDERFHRTLLADVIRRRIIRDNADAQEQFNDYRCVYNQQRPHEALELATPSSRYEPSPRSMPKHLPRIDYAEREVRKVQSDGRMNFRGHEFRLSHALCGQPVALRATETEGRWEIRFCHVHLATLELREGTPRLWPASARCARSVGPEPKAQRTNHV